MKWIKASVALADITVVQTINTQFSVIGYFSSTSLRPDIAETSLGTVVTRERGKVAASETVETAAIVAGLDKVTQTGTRTQKAYTRALRTLVDVCGNPSAS